MGWDSYPAGGQARPPSAGRDAPAARAGSCFPGTEGLLIKAETRALKGLRAKPHWAGAGGGVQGRVHCSPSRPSRFSRSRGLTSLADRCGERAWAPDSRALKPLPCPSVRPGKGLTSGSLRFLIARQRCGKADGHPAFPQQHSLGTRPSGHVFHCGTGPWWPGSSP